LDQSKIGQTRSIQLLLHQGWTRSGRDDERKGGGCVVHVQQTSTIKPLNFLPVDARAARKTSHAVGQATKTVMSIMKQGELNSENIDDSGIDRLEI
ncbi:hypothetical protein V6N13_123067, partial [Hibiscus sabdariffa]